MAGEIYYYPAGHPMCATCGSIMWNFWEEGSLSPEPLPFQVWACTHANPGAPECPQHNKKIRIFAQTTLEIV